MQNFFQRHTVTNSKLKTDNYSYFSQVDLVNHSWGQNRIVIKINIICNQLSKNGSPWRSSVGLLGESVGEDLTANHPGIIYFQGDDVPGIRENFPCRSHIIETHPWVTRLSLPCNHPCLSLTRWNPASMWWQNRMREVCQFVGSLTPAELSNPSLTIGIRTAWDHNPG